MTEKNAPFHNPLQDADQISKVPEPCILVIFGATGDLTARKLVPALYNLAREGQLPSHFACVGFARREKTNEGFRDEMLEAVNKFSRNKPADPNIWNSFSQCLFYHRSEFHEDEGYISLNKVLHDLDKNFGTKGNRVFYLSTAPSYFPQIVEKLSQHKLIYPHDTTTDKWSRVIFEKPFGHDLQSAIDLQKDINKYLDESQVYRIDHYLGKETVQNLLVFRFSNPIFESLWNRHHIDNVQITVAEDIGVGTRGKLWEEAGILRDIVQNHMMQLMTLVTMEPPVSLRAGAIHDEKVKVLDAIRPIPTHDFDKYVARGQYGPGIVDGKEVIGYRSEKDVSPTSVVESYAAISLLIDNWRWSGVPFYLRAGKRMPKKVTEIAITFKHAPGILFQTDDRLNEPNVLVIRIQPDEGISLKTNCKVPGAANFIQPVKLDFLYSRYFGTTPPEAYERLICDCMAGDTTLFARIDEVMSSWKLLTPVLDRWKESPPKDFPNYPSGSWGPHKANALPEKEGRTWRLI
jgi:glucose-6-phosphate 1-dehydrogenase